MPADEAFEAAASVVDETAGREDGAKTPPGADRTTVGEPPPPGAPPPRGGAGRRARLGLGGSRRWARPVLRSGRRSSW